MTLFKAVSVECLSLYADCSGSNRYSNSIINRKVILIFLVLVVFYQ